MRYGENFGICPKCKENSLPPLKEGSTGRMCQNLNCRCIVNEKGEIEMRPKIVCLCGSTRFYKQFQKSNFDETMRGNIVLSVGFYPHAENEVHGESQGITEKEKERLDELHKRKIDLADEVLILNVGGYIGNSTRSEINYAIAHNKIIRYLEN